MRTGAKLECAVEEGAVVERESYDEALTSRFYRGALMPGLGGVVLVVEDGVSGEAAFAED